MVQVDRLFILMISKAYRVVEIGNRFERHDEDSGNSVLPIESIHWANIDIQVVFPRSTFFTRPGLLAIHKFSPGIG